VEQHGPDADGITRQPCGAEWLRAGEERDQQFFEVLIAEPRVPIAGPRLKYMS
jgi:hypothetical protein